jgi:hypothetical protein
MSKLVPNIRAGMRSLGKRALSHENRPICGTVAAVIPH